MASFFQVLANGYTNNLNPGKPLFLPADYPDLSGKTVLITGANAGVGFQATKLLLATGAQVVVVVRNVAKMKEAQAMLTEGGAAPKLEVFQADLSDLTTVGPCAQKIVAKYPTIHIVIHNAGVMTPAAGSVTKQDYELQLGTNALAPYLLQKYLDPAVLAAKTGAFTPRVVWVSSNAYLRGPGPRGLLPFDDLNNKSGKCDRLSLYGQSKVAMNYNCLMYAEKHKGKIITCALNPGALRSDLQRHLSGLQQRVIALVSLEPVYGAYTELYAALSPDITTSNSGCFVRPWGKIEEYQQFIKDGVADGTAKKLNQWTEEQVAPYYKL